MIPIVSVVGESGSGKTELVVRLVPELQKRGRCVGTIKHHVHTGNLDIEGKDTYRHAQAGVGEICLSGPDGICFFRKVEKELTLDEIASWYFADADFILTEGYKREDKPKIEVIRGEGEMAPLSAESELIAVVSDGTVKTDVPVFRMNEADKLADLLVEKFPLPELKNEVRVRVNGKIIVLKSFVKAFIGNTIKGMLVSLRGCKKPEKIDLRMGK